MIPTLVLALVVPSAYLTAASGAYLLLWSRVYRYQYRRHLRRDCRGDVAPNCDCVYGRHFEPDTTRPGFRGKYDYGRVEDHPDWSAYQEKERDHSATLKATWYSALLCLVWPLLTPVGLAALLVLGAVTVFQPVHRLARRPVDREATLRRLERDVKNELKELP